MDFYDRSGSNRYCHVVQERVTGKSFKRDRDRARNAGSPAIIGSNAAVSFTHLSRRTHTAFDMACAICGLGSGGRYMAVIEMSWYFSNDYCCAVRLLMDLYLCLPERLEARNHANTPNGKQDDFHYRGDGARR